jgi:hypothetical protein
MVLAWGHDDAAAESYLVYRKDPSRVARFGWPASLLEELLAKADGMESLRRLDTGGNLALSLYLDVSSPDKRRRVVQRVTRAVEAALSSHGRTAEQAVALQEDLELVRLYFGTSASTRHPYVAIFSCAQQLFWRVLPLAGPVEESIAAAQALDLRPLRECVAVPERSSSLRNDLLPHFNCATV